MEPQQLSEIKELLQNLVKTIRDSPQPPYVGLVISYENLHLIRLIENLKKIEGMEIFDGKTHWFGPHKIESTYERLAYWLIQKSYDNTINYATSILLDYIQKKEIPMIQYGILENTLDEKYSFCNGVTIYPSEVNIESPHIIKSASNQLFAVLSVIYKYPINIRKNESHKNDDRNAFEKMLDTIRCIRLTSPVDSELNIVIRGDFIDPTCSIPFDDRIMDEGWHKLFQTRSLLHPHIDQNTILEADKLLVKYSKLDSGLRDRMNISIDRLNEFGNNHSDVDKAMDLRISMESLFLGTDNSDHSQLSYRLALRCAKFLSKSLEEKKEIFKETKATYDLTSMAVHQGKIKEERKELLKLTAERVQLSIIKIIDKGSSIDWLAIELS